MIIELLIGAMAIATLIGWAYFWFACVNSAEKILKPLFGNASFGIACVGFPFVILGVFGLAIRYIGRENLNIYFWVIALALPLLGIWAVKRGKW